LDGWRRRYCNLSYCKMAYVLEQVKQLEEEEEE
jgi:hypothetical protein